MHLALNTVNSEMVCRNGSIHIMKHCREMTINRVYKQKKLECRPMPNVMIALPNVGGALCSTPQSLTDAD